MAQRPVYTDELDDQFLSPFPEETDSPPETTTSVLTERLSDLDGASIGLLSNTKMNSDHFLRGVGERLEAEYEVTVADVVKKTTATNKAGDAIYDDLAEYDAVLTAYGDCGSCASWTVYDAIQLETSGVPTTVFCSDEFTTLAQFEADNQECPGLPIVEFIHPIADFSPEEVREERVTDSVVSETVEALIRPPADLREKYLGKYTEGVSEEEAITFSQCTI